MAHGVNIDKIMYIYNDMSSATTAAGGFALGARVAVLFLFSISHSGSYSKSATASTDKDGGSDAPGHSFCCMKYLGDGWAGCVDWDSWCRYASIENGRCSRVSALDGFTQQAGGCGPNLPPSNQFCIQKWSSNSMSSQTKACCSSFWELTPGTYGDPFTSSASFTVSYDNGQMTYSEPPSWSNTCEDKTCYISYTASASCNLTYLTHSDTLIFPPPCPNPSATEAEAQAVAESLMAECNSRGGEFRSASLPQADRSFCVSSSCDDCKSEGTIEILANIFASHAEDCCGQGKEPDFSINYSDFCSPASMSETETAYSTINRNLSLNCSEQASGSGRNLCGGSSSGGASSSSGGSSSSEEASSSSSEGASSSSSPGNPSSSSGCFYDYMSAYIKVLMLRSDCEASGRISTYDVGENLCIVGGCDNVPSSTSQGASSSGSGGSNDFCQASSLSSLHKPVNYYDDWIYMGKEIYGIGTARKPAPKFTGWFFDALGKAYKQMQQRWRKYYTKEKMPIGEEYEFDKEFEIWARMIKDHRGDDIQMFIKEDKKNRFRKDSLFYYNGYWQVFEQEEFSGVTRLRASDGTISWSRYDSKNRLMESYLISEKGDTLISERYEWKDGRLAKTIIDGIERVYVYGKTLRDPVTVIPSDEWIKDYYNAGYNGTVGKLPEEGTSEYEIFARGPYRYRYEETPNTNFAAKNSAGSLNVLQKKTDTSGSCVDKELHMPATECIRDEIGKDFTDNAITRSQGVYGWPGEGDFLAYGSSDAELHVDFECKCNAFGKYQPYFSGYTDKEIIRIKQSTWKYYPEKGYWQERCWHRDDLNRTYRHEVQHIKNGRSTANEIIAFASTYVAYDAIEECAHYVDDKRILIDKKWAEWYKKEKAHANPNSPKYGGFRFDDPCN